MEALNRAIEDARDFAGSRDRLIQPTVDTGGRNVKVGTIAPSVNTRRIEPNELMRRYPRRPGENSAQHRARVRALWHQPR